MKISLLALAALLPAVTLAAPYPTPPDVREANVKAIVYREVNVLRKDGTYIGSMEEVCTLEGKVGVYDTRDYPNGFTIPRQNELGRCPATINGQTAEVIVTAKMQLRNERPENKFRKYAVARFETKLAEQTEAQVLYGRAATGDERNISLIVSVSDDGKLPEKYERIERVYGEVVFEDVNQ
jgi:DNA-binding Lrp family transcriptional regulator